MTKPPAYVEAIMRLFRSGVIQRGQVASVVVEHDRDCALMNGLLTCSCKPLVTVRRDAA
jgi:hypothetical protein